MKPLSRTRNGMTLLELMLATAMMTTILTSLSVLVRGSYQAWREHESDLVSIESAHGTLRHILRKVRQAQSVSAITANTNAAGSLSLLMPDGSTVVWARNSSTNEVNYGVSSASNLLAEEIEALRFTGYLADGVTETTDPDEIHAIYMEAVVNLDRDSSPSRTVSCWGWIRSW